MQKEKQNKKLNENWERRRNEKEKEKKVGIIKERNNKGSMIE